MQGFWQRIRTRIAGFGKLVLASNRTPGQVFIAIVLGCIVGCLPLYGVQIFLCMGLCRLLNLNLPIMYGAANISIPPLLPPLAWASVQLGEKLWHGHFLRLVRHDFSGVPMLELIKRFFVAWLIGGILLGAIIGTIIGGIIYLILRHRARQAAAATPTEVAIDAAIRRAANRYAQTPRKFRYYAAAKYRMDPCYRALCARIPEDSQVVDLGCGLGMLALALAELGGNRRTLGIDWDGPKIEAGNAAARDLPTGTVTLVRDDVRNAAIPPCEVITIIDVLHYYDPATQTAILERAVSALKPGGHLFIRETDPEKAGGARLTRWFERNMVRWGWNRGPQVYYRPLTELHTELARLGCASEQLAVAGATHPGNVLLCAVKPPRVEQAGPR